MRRATLKDIAAAAKDAPELGPAGPPQFSDEAFALAFAERHELNMRYVAKWGCWMIYQNGVWRRDETLKSFTRVRAITRPASAEAPDKRTATRIASGQTVAAVEKLARSDTKFAATVEQWDVDPMLLNTPGGTVDLRDGKLIHHAPEDYLSKRTAVTPKDRECPLWLKFLDRVTASDLELQGYLQRLSGYCLTGSVVEDVLNLMFGTGRNGKGTYLDIIQGIMGDYAMTVGAEMFMESPYPRHTTDLAQLQGMRLVLAQELNKGQKWNEAILKSMTGGGRQRARFMRQDNFEFDIQYKIIMSSNYKPGLNSVDEAISARMRLIPFDVFIPPAERDPDLRGKLKTEWPGILQWMIEGCLEWQRIGLAAPSRVLVATEGYLREEDTVGRWLSECCEEWSKGSGVKRSDFYGRSSVMFKSWQFWCEQNNERAGSHKALTEYLVENRKFVKKDMEFGAVFFDVRPTAEDGRKRAHAERARGHY